jgi:hypothetical protein
VGSWSARAGAEEGRCGMLLGLAPVGGTCSIFFRVPSGELPLRDVTLQVQAYNFEFDRKEVCWFCVLFFEGPLFI